MSKWSQVGNWLKDNGGTGVALVGSLLSGNVPGAIAAGVSLVSSATGSDNPVEALTALQSDPSTMLKLKELYYRNEDSVRKHLEEMTRLELEDKQKEHHETQETIRSGDKAEDKFIRWTRPGQSWLSLFAGIYYGLSVPVPSFEIMAMLFTLPLAYAGLRQVGKWKDSTVAAITGAKK